MRTVDSIQELVSEQSCSEYITKHPAPVLVSFRHLEGDLKANPQTRYSPVTGAPITNTMFLVKPRLNAAGEIEDETYELEIPRFAWISHGEAHEAHETITIGRYIDSQITVNDFTISADHAWFLVDNYEGAYFVVDRGSTNGTFIDGERLRPHLIHEIRSGQDLVLGRVVFRFLDAEAFYKAVTEYLKVLQAGVPAPD